MRYVDVVLAVSVPVHIMLVPGMIQQTGTYTRLDYLFFYS